MERFDKKTMNIDSPEYESLLKKEIQTWSTYSSSKEAKSSCKEYGQSLANQTYRKGTIEKELSFIKNAGADIDVLELGSADGWLSNEISVLKNVKTVTAIDVSLTDCLSKKYDDKINVIQGDLNKISNIVYLKNRQFDCVITHGTLHHLVNPYQTLSYAINNLLKPGGIIIINDTWTLQPLQLKINALSYVLINRLINAIIKFNGKEVINILFYKAPKIVFNSSFAESIAHNHNASPFESISSANDYRQIYSEKNLRIIYFRNFAALPGLQNSWFGAPMIIHKIIQKIDELLINIKLLVGDLHICILKKDFGTDKK